MSGCVHCVYTIYASELETYSIALSAAQKALEGAKTPRGSWPIEVRELSIGHSEETENDAERLVKREERKMANSMDSSMSAFLA